MEGKKTKMVVYSKPRIILIKKLRRLSAGTVQPSGTHSSGGGGGAAC